FLGTGAGTFVAGRRGRDADLGLAAAERVLQANGHVVAEIRATAGPAAATARAAHELPEHLLEDVGEASGEPGAAAGSRAAGILECRVAETIVGRLLVVVL